MDHELNFISAFILFLAIDFGVARLFIKLPLINIAFKCLTSHTCKKKRKVKLNIQVACCAQDLRYINFLLLDCFFLNGNGCDDKYLLVWDGITRNNIQKVILIEKRVHYQSVRLRLLVWYEKHVLCRTFRCHFTNSALSQIRI